MGWIQDLWSFKKNPFSIKELNKSDELKKLFVNRQKELRLLRNTLTGSEGGIVYGISGIRGSGKSTVLNKALDEVKNKNGLIVTVKASGTYTGLDFLQKLLNDICDQVEIQKLPKNVVEEIIRLRGNLLYNEKMTEGKGSDSSIRASIKASIFSLFGSEVGSEIKEKIEKSVAKQLKPYSKSTLTREILQLLFFLKKKTKFNYITVGIDETDKCRFEVAENLLDSVKTVLGSEHCHFIFVGTTKFYENFIKVFKKQEEEATLASIFDNIILIEPFSDKEIMKIINKRLKYYSIKDKPKNPFEEKTMQIMLELSKGNPKQAMRLCSESFMYFGDEGKKIVAADLAKYFESKGYFPDLTPTEKKYVNVIKKLGDITSTSEKFREELAKKGIKHKTDSQYRVNISRLVEKRYLKKIITKKKETVYALSEFYKHIP